MSKFLSSVYPSNDTFYVVAYDTGHEDGKEKEICYETNSLAWAQDFLKKEKENYLNLEIFEAKIDFKKKIEIEE